MKLQSFCPLLILFFFILQQETVFPQVVFDSAFSGERLRIDYRIDGNSAGCKISEAVFIREPQWGGPRKNLVDTFLYGEMIVEITDPSNGNLIYSHGYSSMFKEWQTIEEAGEKDTLFTESVFMPFPQEPVNISIAERRGNLFRRLFTFSFDPLDSTIRKAGIPADCKVIQSRKAGPPEKNLDIVFVSEGYTAKERSRFFAEAGELAGSFINTEPYSRFADRIRFHLLFNPSAESGTDNPLDSVWVNTAMNTSFNTLGSDRYLSSKDMQGVYDKVSQLPYDQICILVNTDKYGGAGVYNGFTVVSAGNEYALFLLFHEFGHAFASLADEYYTSAVSYTNYFDLNSEPYQPNITTLNNFDSKWKSLLADDVPVPTPDSALYDGVVGVFEGAGYSAKGIYRPFRTCIMKSKETSFFCPVCQKAISDMLKFQTDYE